MGKKFEIIKKKYLPDNAQIKGFTFLKEPTKEDKEKNKYDFIEFSNGNEVGCMLPKRKNWAFNRGYVKADDKANDFIEVKTRWPILIIILGFALCLLLISLGGQGEIITPSIQPHPVIEDPIGDFNVSDKQQDKEEVKPVVDDRTITFAGYGKYTVSSDKPNIELENPAGNFVDMVFTLTDKTSGEIIARTGKVKAGEFVYVNVMDFYKQSGTYNVVILTSTYDSESGAQMNGMNQEMEVIIK